jgi:NAD(P)H-hydrate epimerase
MEYLPIELYTVQQIRAIEQIAINQLAIPAYSLMQRAGNSAMDAIREYWTEAKNLIVVCGSGNNGGDGYVLARLAKLQGKNVRVFFVGDVDSLQGRTAFLAWQDCHAEGISVQPFEGQDLNLMGADLIVDALLGIGLSSKVQPPYQAAIESINNAHLPVLALDVPSGISADTGQVLGVAVKANVTLTFIGLKQGLLTGDATEYCGHLIFNDLGVPKEAVNSITPAAKRISYVDCIPYLGPRSRNSNKGQYGHVLVIGGDCGYAGAARMAAEAAARVGAGLVSVATRPENVAIIASARPELMAHGISEYNDLEPLLNHATVVVIGPGMGQGPWGQQLLGCLMETDLPLVVDADGLNLLSNQPRTRTQWVITPHPGEAARLLNCSVPEVQANRFAAVRALQKRYCAITLLKGAGTLVADNEEIRISSEGNPGMATGGMGDILSGVIGGLCAQRIPLFQSAFLGVCIHARAADIVRKDGERGMLPLDLMPQLRRLVNP